MQKYLYLSLILIFALPGIACDSTTTMQEEEEEEKEETASEVSFDFDNPDLEFQLPPQLDEISGISFINDTSLVAVDDERGFMYFINANTGEVGGGVQWGSAGDYEDIEVVGNQAWILRSDGTLFELLLNDAYELSSVTEYDTPLLVANDTEGLAFDSANNRLLIACKESPGIGYSGFSRTVYAFDLDTKSLLDTAVLVIDFEETNGTSPIEGYGVQDFKPSAIGIHPRTKEWFISSAVKKGALTFLDGELSGISNWDENLFQKPEGIAFNENGDMFVSNEANGQIPTLLRFNARYQNN